MIDVKKIPQAYKEVYEILKYVPKEDYNKIPKTIINVIVKNMDTSYEFEVEEFEDFQKQKMLEETECILAVLYRDYWATEKERNIILKKEELDKKTAYMEKGYSDVFYKQDFNNKENDIEDNEENSKDNNSEVQIDSNPEEFNESLIEVKESFFKKLLKRIIALFK